MHVIMKTSVFFVVVVVVSYSSGIGMRIFSFAPSSALTKIHFVKSLPTECCSGRGGATDPYSRGVGSNVNPEAVWPVEVFSLLPSRCRLVTGIVPIISLPSFFDIK